MGEAGDDGASVPTPLEKPCSIEVLDLLRADKFRGVPFTPQMEASRRHLDRQTAAKRSARDHARGYLVCTYRVAMKGRSYRLKYVGARDFMHDDQLAVSRCETPEMRDAARARIREVTIDCTDPHGGTASGDALEEEP